jgi:hypothetical protein
VQADQSFRQLNSLKSKAAPREAFSHLVFTLVAARAFAGLTVQLLRWSARINICAT